MVIANVLPVWCEIPLTILSIIGSVLGIVMTILNIDLAWARVRQGAGRVKATLRRGP